MSTTPISQTPVYLPTILLDETNYPTWLFRLQSFLRGQNLYEFVDGSVSCPSQYVLDADGTTSVLSRDYIAWKTQDQNIINLLGQTLSPKAMSCVVGSQSAQEMWSRLKLKFAAPNRQNTSSHCYGRTTHSSGSIHFKWQQFCSSISCIISVLKSSHSYCSTWIQSFHTCFLLTDLCSHSNHAISLCPLFAIHSI